MDVNSNDKAYMDVEDSLVKIVGGFGRYQIFMCLMMSFLSISLAGLIALPVFTTANVTELQHYNYRVKNDSSVLFEWDLFNEMWLSDLIQALYFSGFLVGVIALGQLSDKFGRLLVLKIGVLLLFPISLCTSFSTSWEMFAVFRFFTGFLSGGGNTVLYLLLQEKIGNRWWAISSAVHGMFYTCGFAVYSGLAYFIPAWRELVQVLAILQIPTLLFILYSEKSPRWLYSKNRIPEAEKVLYVIARRNGVKNPETNLNPVPEENRKSNLTLVDVLKNGTALKYLIILSFLWFVVSLVYYALILAAGDLNSNIYISEALVGLVDIPSHLTYPWFVNRKWSGRKRTTTVCFLIGGASCLSLMAFKTNDSSTAKIALGLLGKVFVSMSFSILYIYTPELFPTPVRNVALGAASMCGRVGGILSSFAQSFIQLDPLYAYLTFGLCAVSAGLLTLLLPETLGRKPPDSFEEFQNRLLRNSNRVVITSSEKLATNEKTPLLTEGDNDVTVT